MTSKATAHSEQKISSWKQANGRFATDSAELRLIPVGSMNVPYSSRMDIVAGCSDAMGLSSFEKANPDTMLKTIFFR